MKRILIVTGSRSDYGKLKQIALKLEQDRQFELFMFVTGMHLLNRYGATYKFVIKDGYKNIYLSKKIYNNTPMDIALARNIANISAYVNEIHPDMIIVHGDRIEALAAAIVGMLNNIYVSHIEGGEVTGTVDEKIRHAITKIVDFHFVSNDTAKKRVIQLGEDKNRIYVVGSPDIDTMISEKLPKIENIKTKNNINFEKYAICIFHPVTTELDKIRENTKKLVDALIKSNYNYIIIFPNNDMGSNYIEGEYKKIKNNEKFKIFASLEFEEFLTLLKNCEFVIGNSSIGIRECGIYGIPSINIGTRQHNRADMHYQKNIQTIENIDSNKICEAITKINSYRVKDKYFGDGYTSEKILEILKNKEIWKLSIQKKFIDLL